MDARTPAANASVLPEVVAEFPDHWPSGIAPARDGRLFVSFPRLDATPAPINLGELIDGKLVPYPDELVNAIDPGDAEHRFVNVHGIALGPGGRLLALDTGARSLERCDPGAAKLYVIDLDRNAIVHGIGFPDDVCLPTTYLNDLVIDYARGKAGYAYVSDSGAKGPNGIVVVDLDSGKSWRRLSGHASVRAEQRPGFGIATESGPIAVTSGIDGIALSPDGRTLWWTPLGSYALYSIDTDVLTAPHATPEWVERHVVQHDARDFASDGLDCDREGRVYFTDVTHGTLQRLIPAEHRFETLLHGEHRFIWPDAVKLGPERIVYVTDSQVNRMPNWQGGRDLRTPPYRLYRAAIDADPAQY
ncbi:MAG TPA: L-dopachrome tautomerase-related protein [Candidatus Elarobacter sp.]|jgi:sugar lactone lactonase YvrE|nr:L-dopachrome tautomerase-related protein [Candidatus Elarobacter sp.]